MQAEIDVTSNAVCRNPQTNDKPRSCLPFDFSIDNGLTYLQNI